MPQFEDWVANPNARIRWVNDKTKIEIFFSDTMSSIATENSIETILQDTSSNTTTTRSLVAIDPNDEPVTHSTLRGWANNVRAFRQGGKEAYIEKMNTMEPYTYNNTAAFDAEKRIIADTDIEHAHNGVIAMRSRNKHLQVLFDWVEKDPVYE